MKWTLKYNISWSNIIYYDDKITYNQKDIIIYHYGLNISSVAILAGFSTEVS